MSIEELRDEIKEISAVKDAWVARSKNIHVIVEGRSYSDYSKKIKDMNLKQIDHKDAVYSGEKRHYVYEYLD